MNKDHSDVPICLNFIKLDCRVQVYDEPAYLRQ